MVLAAGLGTRMRPLTERVPKPMIEVAGHTLIDRALDHLVAAGVTRAVVNTHYKARLLERHLAGRKSPEIVISREDDLLDTGGGVKKALPYFGDEPFFVANSDALWLDGYRPALSRLVHAWNGRRMDALLLLHPTVAINAYQGLGDFFLDPEGPARRRCEDEVAPFVFAGVQILHPRLFRDAPEGRFSLNLLYDKAERAGRLYGIRHDGPWYHVGTPESIAQAEALIAGRDPSLDWI